MALRRQEFAENFPFLNQFTAPVKKMERPLIGRENELRTLRAAMMRPELCNVILLAEAGSGKALADWTPIPVADSRGYVTIHDIVPGDFVFDETGRPVKVLRVFPQGWIPAYLVKFSDGSEIVCNDEHIWAARQAKANSSYENLTLRELLNQGLFTKNHTHYKWRVPIGRAVAWPEQELPIHPYVMGALITGGCLTERLLTLSTAKEDVAVRVADLIGAVTKRNPTNYSWRFKIRSDLQACISTNEFAEKLGSDAEVFHRRAVDRRIPRIYLTGSVSQRFELVRGMMDVCGRVASDSHGSCYFTAPCKQIALDMQAVLNSLGYRAVLWEPNSSRRKYKLRIQGNREMKSRLFYAKSQLERVQRLCSDRPVRDDLTIVDVQKLHRDEKMTCIYVDGASHLFQCGVNHIVTHNTALVQGMMAQDAARDYMEVDLSRMIADVNDRNEMASKLKSMFEEVTGYRKAANTEVVLFIDEFHQIMQLSDAAVEALKPLLADSGTRGVRVIAATTYEEFRKWVSPNLPLVERLQRINLAQPGKEVCVEILKNMAKRYGVEHQFIGDSMFEMIYEYTNRYMPSASQPRKSILLMDAMIGWHRAEGRRIDQRLLADVIWEQEGVNVAFRVDATKIKQALDKRVFSQKLATTVIEQRLQICVADLNDKTKPMSSFLFTGSTGVGKGHPVGTLIPTVEQRTCPGYTVVEQIQVGDHVFAPDGSPVEVLGVFPRGYLDVYRVTFSDGRSVVVDKDHLWGVYLYKHDRADDNLVVISTQRIANMLSGSGSRSTRKLRFSVPMNQPVQYEKRDLPVDPYVMGAFIADGCLTRSVSALCISGDDEFIVAKCAERVGASGYKRHGSMHHRADGSARTNYSWYFIDPSRERPNTDALLSKMSVFGGIEGVVDTKSTERRIPAEYLTASVEQRGELLLGLFDCDWPLGAIDGGRYNVSYSTACQGLAEDVQRLLWSLGVTSSITEHHRDNGQGSCSVEYDVHVRMTNDRKARFFSLPRKVEIAKQAAMHCLTKSFDVDFSDIVAVEKLSDQMQTVCLYVDHPDHLYQSEDFVVTHNTEMTKALAELLFDDDRNLIRIDCTEYANSDSLERFRSELTNKVWMHPYSIILLDEIEKACSEVTRVLLQVLDDGRLIDDNNREVTFTNAYIVMTTNAGSEVYRNISQYNVDDEGSGREMKQYNKLIRKSITETTGGNRFPPELLGRIDCMVPFQPLSENTLNTIVESKLIKLRHMVREKHGVNLAITKDVIRYIVADNLDTDSDSGGARVAVAKLESEVTTEVARFINKHPDCKRMRVFVDGKMAVDDINRRISEATIRVVAE